MRVKICGLTTLEDTLAAADAGADMLGFNFYPASPRYITPGSCAAIVSRLRDRGFAVAAVGVFVNEDNELIRAVADDCGLDLLQLHGDEPPEALHALGSRAFKALRPASAAEAATLLARYGDRAAAPAVLLDGYRPGLYGGSGATGDWSLAAEVARQRPILLAGGLTPDNVAAAVRQVLPWGVDVASGVEDRPGRKDHAKVAAFIAAARGAAARPSTNYVNE